MNDPRFQPESTREPLSGDEPPHTPHDAPRTNDDAPRANENAALAEDAPQFGAVDIVEAFTALRHEWRGQTKESRALAELIQAAAAGIQTLETKLLARLAEPPANSRSAEAGEAKPLALLIVETDHQLSRAVAAIAQWEANRRLRVEADAQAVEHYHASMGALARWLARPLLAFVVERIGSQASSEENPAVEGLNHVLARLRRVMHEQAIERVDVLGQPFDAETMHAIGTVAAADCPSGHVAEQLSPAYRWHGRILRYADVRVAP